MKIDGKYFGNWSCAEDVAADFCVPGALNEAVVIAATYDTADYEGHAMVVFRKEGKLYEVHGSHCSCNGLENQWHPEETTYEALIDRLDKSASYEIDKRGEDFYKAVRKGLIDEMFEREVLES